MAKDCFELEHTVAEGNKVFLFFLIFIGLPIALLCIPVLFFGRDPGMGIGFILFILFWIVIFVLASRKKPIFASSKHKKYRFKVKDAYKLVDVIPASESDLQDLYSSGAMYFRYSDETSILSYAYNLFKDKGVFTGERLSVYKASPDTFLAAFPYYDPSLVGDSPLYLIPYSEFDLTRSSYNSLLISDRVHLCYFHDFEDFADGLTNRHGEGIRFTYKPGKKPQPIM